MTWKITIQSCSSEFSKNYYSWDNKQKPQTDLQQSCSNDWFTISAKPLFLPPTIFKGNFLLFSSPLDQNDKKIDNLTVMGAAFTVADLKLLLDKIKKFSKPSADIKLKTDRTVVYLQTLLNQPKHEQILVKIILSCLKHLPADVKPLSIRNIPALIQALSDSSKAEELSNAFPQLGEEMRFLVEWYYQPIENALEKGWIHIEEVPGLLEKYAQREQRKKNLYEFLHDYSLSNPQTAPLANLGTIALKKVQVEHSLSAITDEFGKLGSQAAQDISIATEISTYILRPIAFLGTLFSIYHTGRILFRSDTTLAEKAWSSSSTLFGIGSFAFSFVSGGVVPLLVGLGLGVASIGSYLMEQRAKEQRIADQIYQALCEKDFLRLAELAKDPEREWEDDAVVKLFTKIQEENSHLLRDTELWRNQIPPILKKKMMAELKSGYIGDDEGKFLLFIAQHSSDEADLEYATNRLKWEFGDEEEYNHWNNWLNLKLPAANLLKKEVA